MTENTDPQPLAPTSEHARRILREHDVLAFVTMDTVAPLAERIRAHLDTGRPMTLIRQWSYAPEDLEIRAGLHVNDAPDSRTPIDLWHTDHSVGFRVDLTPGIESFGFSATSHDDPSEKAVAARYHLGSQDTEHHNLTRVHITGWPTGRDTTIRVEHWNNDRVGCTTTIAFSPLPSAAVIAASQAAILDTLAEARPTWTPQTLRATAQRAREHWLPIREVLNIPSAPAATSGPTTRP